MKMQHATRRQFLQWTTLAGAGFWVGCQSAKVGGRRLPANEKLNIGVVGVAHRGGSNLSGVAGENIVALCDVDDTYLRAAAEKFPKAQTYADFRRMLDRTDLDAVVCSTADHTHAVVGVAALRGVCTLAKGDDTDPYPQRNAYLMIVVAPGAEPALAQASMNVLAGGLKINIVSLQPSTGPAWKASTAPASAPASMLGDLRPMAVPPSAN